MDVVYEVDRNAGNQIFLKNQCRMAEWSALQTGKRGYSSSIPAEVKTFFGGISNLEQCLSFLIKFKFKIKKLFSKKLN